MFRPLLVALGLLALASSACVSKPTVKLNHAEIRGVQLGWPPQVAVQMTVVLDVYNPNGYDVAVRAVRGQTVLASRYAIPVEFRAEGNGVWLPSKQTTAVSVPVNVPAQTALALLGEALGGAPIPYRFAGKADVTGTRTFAIEEDDYAVDEQGEIPRAQLESALRSLPLPQLPGLPQLPRF